MEIGNQIKALRLRKGATQKEMAQHLGITEQAISKWENSASVPDIALLPLLAKTLGVTVDHLLTGEKPEPPVRLVPEGERKDFKDMFLKVTMISSEGDKMRVNLPMLLVQTAMDAGVSIAGSPALKQLDFQEIVTLVQQGATGEIVEMESTDGDILRVVVE